MQGVVRISALERTTMQKTNTKIELENTQRKNTPNVLTAQKCNDLDEGIAANNKRLSFEVLQTLTKSKQSRAWQMEDNDKKLLTGGNETLERWTE